MEDISFPKVNTPSVEDRVITKIIKKVNPFIKVLSFTIVSLFLFISCDVPYLSKGPVTYQDKNLNPSKRIVLSIHQCVPDKDIVETFQYHNGTLIDLSKYSVYCSGYNFLGYKTTKPAEKDYAIDYKKNDSFRIEENTDLWIIWDN